MKQIIENMQVVRHKKSGKLYASLGTHGENEFDAVFYRCHDDGLIMPRDGTRIRLSMLEVVPGLVARYV
jgi:hypothetical protein